MSELTYKSRTNSRKHIHQSFEDLIEELINNLGDLKRYKTMEENKPNYKLTYIDVADLIMYTCDIIRIPLDKSDILKSTYVIYNPSNNNYIRNDEFLKALCNIILSNESNCKLSLITTAREVDAIIQTSINKIRIANLPPTHIVKFNNCIFDIKEKNEHNGLDNQNKEYDFVNKVDYDLKNIDDVNDVYLEHVKKMFNLWSSNKEENELLLRQMVLAAIEGDGRNKYIILKSEGGDGKSTFQYILELFAGSNNTQRINLHQFGDDNAINTISEATKLIIGDDLMSRYKVTNKAMTILKSIVSGDTINVNVKFMPNKLIRTNAVMLQNTNTDVNFYENSPALKQRIIIVNWPHYDFRKNPITDFNLDELLGRKNYNQNKDFIEAILSYVMFNTPYFNRFNITAQMQLDTDNELASNDSINLFIDDLKEKNIFEYSYLPTKAIYEYYKIWLKTNNPGSSPMKAREFSQRFNKEIIELGYIDNGTKRLNKIKRYKFNFKLLMSLNDLNEKSYNKSTYYNMVNSNEVSRIYLKKENTFNEQDLEKITDILINTEDFDQLKSFPLPEIQYCIESLCQTKLSLLANLESIDKMYIYSKDELIEKLNM